MALNKIRDFLRLEAASGVILFIAALVAMFWANSPWASTYVSILNSGALTHWVNDGLMTLFFLLVGLELKREFVEGELSGVNKIILPGMAALGGMFLPALIYIGFNYHDDMTLKGWAIPVATDIAFALGVLSFFSKHIPLVLKLFLLALAVFDDLGAIVIIAIFYAHDVSWIYLGLAGVLTIVLYGLNHFFRVVKLSPYLLLGLALWFFILNSGVHASIAGVVLAMMVPIRDKSGQVTPLHDLEQKLHPWVAYGVLPLFAFCNAGFSLAGLSFDILLSPMVLGIVVGLFVGKQIGVLMMVWIMTKLQFAKWTESVTFLDLYGIALLCGIGFTMSLFLGTLAFQTEHASYLTQVRCGVFLGSLLSAIGGAIILQMAIFQKRKRRFSL